MSVKPIILIDSESVKNKCIWKSNGSYECDGKTESAVGITISSTGIEENSYGVPSADGAAPRKRNIPTKTTWKLGAGYIIKPFESCKNQTKQRISEELFSQWSTYFKDVNGLTSAPQVLEFFTLKRNDNPLFVMFDQKKEFVGTIAVDHTAPLQVLAVPCINHLYVAGSRRQTGYGRTLMRWAEQYVASMGFSLASLWCYPDMESFYTALGWRRIKVTSSTSSGETVVIMGKHV